jgi:hypothetical protein
VAWPHVSAAKAARAGPRVRVVLPATGDERPRSSESTGIGVARRPVRP